MPNEILIGSISEEKEKWLEAPKIAIEESWAKVMESEEIQKMTVGQIEILKMIHFNAFDDGRNYQIYRFKELMDRV